MATDHRQSHSAPRILFRALFRPIAQRFLRGEGVLLAIIGSLILTSGGAPATMAVQFLISFWVLALLYAHNDLVDSGADQKNPKKDRGLARDLAAYGPRVKRPFAIVELITPFVALLSLGASSAYAVGLVLVVNALYSWLLKRTVVVDILWVGLCGGLYVLVPGLPLKWTLVGVVFLMTAASHVFQCLGDRQVDHRAGVRTTAVWSPRLASGSLFVLCGLMAWAVSAYLPLTAAATAFVPFVLQLAFREPHRAWLLAKLYFGALWLALLFLSDVPFV